MRKRAVDKSWSRHNVPMEIWSDILARLPARSLVRFRCVSRSWKVLIDDPDFCQEHLVRFKNNRDETHLLMVQGGVQYCFVRCSDTMKISRRLGCLGVRDKKTRECKSTATPGFNGIWRICFSVDGLVMLRCDISSLKPKLMLWNPSIKKCRLVQHSDDTTQFQEFGMGFDSLIKDYKLVRVSQHMGSAKVYTVGTASWRTVTVAQGIVLPVMFPGENSIYFKGCLCICSKSGLISFDLSREVFKSVDLPEYDNCARKYARENLTLVDGGSSLAVLQFSIATRGGSMWVLDDNATVPSWSMRCTFAFDLPRFLYLKKNGDLLLDTALSYKYQVVSYNIHTEEERVTNYPKRINRIYGYKESLVLLK